MYIRLHVHVAPHLVDDVITGDFPGQQKHAIKDFGSLLDE